MSTLAKLVADENPRVRLEAVRALGKINSADAASAALTVGPVADQVKAVRAAVEAKNRFHHERIFRGIVLSQVAVPDWLGIELTAEQIETRRKAAISERLAKLPELDAAVRKALEMKPHTVEIVPVSK